MWTISPILLLDIINKSLKTGNFPEDWKHGTVIPIPMYFSVRPPENIDDIKIWETYFSPHKLSKTWGN